MEKEHLISETGELFQRDGDPREPEPDFEIDDKDPRYIRITYSSRKNVGPDREDIWRMLRRKAPELLAQYGGEVPNSVILGEGQTPNELGYPVFTMTLRRPQEAQK